MLKTLAYNTLKNFCTVAIAAQKTKHKTLQKKSGNILRYLEIQTENENDK